MGAGIQVKVHSFSTPGTVKQTLFGRRNPQCLSELKARGGGSFQISRRDPKIVKDPTLLAGRNVAKVSVDGNTVGAFLMGDKESVLVDADAVPGYQLGGEGLKFWFDDAEVRPYGGLQALSQTERYFNFASEQGSWYNPSDWVNVFDLGQIGTGTWPMPDKWPDQAKDVRWIWASAYANPMPYTPCYFRQTVNIATAGRYAIYSVADDMFELYVDGAKIQTSDVKQTAYRQANRVEVTLTTGNHIIAYKAQNNPNAGFQGPAVLASALLLVNSDNTETKVAGSDTAGGWKCLPYPTTVPGWTPGEVLTTLLVEAQARGVLFPTYLNRTFTATTDSYGVAWPEKSDWSFKVGESLLSVVEKLEEAAVDIWIDPATFDLNMVPVRGVDRSVMQGNGTWTEKWRNLQANASFEAAGTSVIVRQNLVINPLGSTATASTGYGAVNGSTVAFDTTTKGVRITCVAGGTTDSGVAFMSAITGLAANTVYTISMDVTGEVADGWRISAQGNWAPGGITNGVYATVAVGETKRVSLTFTSTATTGGAIYLLRQTAATASQAIIKNVMVEVWNKANPYMDGATRPRVMENFAQDPGAASSSGGNGTVNSWGGPSGVTQTFRNVTAAWSKSGKAHRTTWSVLPSNNQGVAQVGGLKPIIRTGGLWTFRFKMKVTGGGAPPSGTGVSFTEFGTGNTTGTHGTIQTAPNEWVIWATANITDWAAFQAQSNPRVDKTLNNPTLSTVMELSELDIYPGAYQPDREWFWGSSTLPVGLVAAWEGTVNASRSYIYDDDFSIAWGGTVNASVSNLTGIQASGVGAGTGRFVIRSKRWAKRGTYSIRIIPGFSGDGSTGTFSIGNLTGSTTYTAVATGYVSKVITSPAANANGRTIYYLSASNQRSAKIPNQVGDFEVRFTFVTDNIGSETGVRLGGDTEDIWWDDLTIVEGVYNGPAFDGNTVTADPLTAYQWTGTVNNSHSIIQRQGIGSTPVEFRIGKHLRRATTKAKSKIKNSLSLKTEEGWTTDTSATSISKYGVLEGSLDTGASKAVALQLSKLVFAQRAQEEEGATYDFIVQDYIPFVHFDIGDWVLAPNDQGLMVKRRVMSIALQETDGGQPVYTVEFDTIFRENEERLNRIVEKLSGGGVGGGMANVQGVTPGVGYPIQAPPDVPPIQLKPKAPTGLAVTTNTGLWTADGTRTYTRIVLDWNDVVQNTDNSATVPAYYQVWGFLQGNPNYIDFGQVATSTIDIQSAVPGQQWVFQVRAVSTTGVLSDWSSTLAFTAASPSTPMGAPDTPTLATDNGLLIITWNGQIAGAAPPKQFRYTYAEVGTSSTGPWTRKGNVISGAGQISVPNETLGAQRWVRLFAVDGAGILSTVSATAGPITIVGVDTGDLSSAVTAAIAAAKEAGLAAAEQSNMLGDPSFELNTNEFWTLGTSVTNVTTLPRTGSRHLRIPATTTAREAFRYNRNMPCQPGDTFYFRLYIDPQTTVPDDGLVIRVMSGATTALGTITEVEGSGALTAAGYIQVTGNWTVPAGINYFKPQVWVADTNNTSVYFVDDFRILKMTGPVDLVAGSVTADKIAAASIVAEHLQANSVAAVNIQANAVTSDKIAANSITGDKIIANSIDTNHVKSGAIQTTHLSPSVGTEINIDGNVTITAQAARIDGVESDLEGTQDNVAEMQLYYSFGPTGAVISKPGSIFATRIDNDSIDMLENGNVISYWNSGTMYVNQLVGEKVTLGNHQLEKFGTGTVVRSLG